MDPATAIANSKENIQPLRYGRNVAQLGTALRAQEDVEAQQLLLQERQMHETAIKNYEGEDPLENWYEYILWVEQSYPKNGHESHVSKLLQQCLTIFEKETKYHQDRRYIRLWINYISMQKNPLELYQLLYNNGIGTMVADMYRAWAFELEQIEDYKRADKVYLLGLSAKAEPQDELDYAHRNFQLAVARKTLGHTEDRSERTLFEQRQAFSSLRAIKAGKRVSSVRTGHRVREHFPGTVPQVSSTVHNATSNFRIQIYQDDVPGEMKGSSILDHVPVEDAVHKENTIKPGPWSGNKRCPLMISVTKSAFKVHEDQPDDLDTGKVRLFPNHTYYFDGSKYPEYSTVPVFVPDAPNPHVMLRPQYPKDLVYANNMDLSMEEIRAQRYLQRRQPPEKRYDVQDMRETEQVQHKSFEAEHQRHNVSLQEMLRQRQELKQQEELTERHRKLQQQQREDEQFEIDRQRLRAERQELRRQQYEAESQALETQRREAEQRELERLNAERMEAERLEAQRMEADRLEAQRMEAERIEAQRMEAERLEAQRMEADRLEAQRIEAELNSQRKLQASSFMHQHHAPTLSTEPDEHLLGQSITVNTKEALSVVQDMWRSPDRVPTTPNFRGSMTPRIPDSKMLKLGFDIHMDSSMTQHVMSTSKHHSGYNVQPYNDQENHQNYSTHQGYHNQEHQTSYSSPGLHNAYQYQMQQHHEQQVPQPHSRPHHSQHHHSLMQPHQQAHMVPHHQSPLSHPSHLQTHSQIHHPPHHQPHQPSPNQHLHHQPHHPHMQHMQHTIYGNMPPTDIGYQQYPSQLESTLLQQNVEPPKQLQYSPYNVPDIETSKPYRMPPELPYIKSPGMNRRDIKYLESAEDKENAIVVDYNGPIEENITSKPADENNLYIDESLGISPLSGNNDTCFTEAFNTQLTSSTPMTNHFRQSYKAAEGTPQYSNQCTVPQTNTEVPNNEGEDKLSVILESTREYISSSSSSSAHTRTTASGFTFTKEDLAPIKEHSICRDEEEDTKDIMLAANQTYEQKVHAQIQAVHAQSPRTVQRNVDQITSEIKKNCDLRKSINFKLNEMEEQEKVDTMECEEHHEPMEQAEEESFQFPSGDINPFDKNLIAGLLKKIKFPQPYHAEGYVRLDTTLNKLVPSRVMLGNETYDVEKCLGKGMYGTVFKAVDVQTGQTVALKVQKPAWVWEFYITREIKARLTNPHVLRGFMDVSKGYVANNSSVLVSEYSKFGTLLAVTNQIKIATGKPLLEPLAVFFTIEMLQIVEYLHKCQIIHGDIKPDNFLLMRLPTEDVRPTIQLIDFGCSIDMSLFPEKTTFTQVIKTEDFTCIEMQTGRPWTYQTDLYCLAATSHCLLFGNYMRVTNVGGRWFITSKLPRYAKRDAWEQFFTELLNIESCEKMPDLSKLRNMMEETLAQMTDVQQRIRNFANILNNR